MRQSLALAVVLLAAPLAASASEGGTYADCAESADPADCIARRALESKGLTTLQMLDTVLRHGLVDLVPTYSKKLIQGLYSEVGRPGRKMVTPEEQLLDSSSAAALRRMPPATLLAAIALVAAARHDANPFANPIYSELAGRAQGDPRIASVAMGVWENVIAMSGYPPDFRVTHAGLETIWNQAMLRKEKDIGLLQDVANTLAFVNVMKPRAEEFYLWFSQQPGLTPVQRIEAASSMARFLDMDGPASALLQGIGDDFEGYDVSGVRDAIATVRLARGYEATLARQVEQRVLDNLSQGEFSYRIPEKEYDALERAGAQKELREIGEECLRRAKTATYGWQAVQRYAGASEFYLRAGDRERAREIARLGLPLAAAIDYGDSRAAPAVALYRAGAIDEALKTGLLTGGERYKHAARAGEKTDPRGAVEDGTWDSIMVMTFDAARSTDHDFQQRAYDALLASCRTSLAQCNSERLRDMAVVAAGMGDEVRMKEALAAATRQLGRAYPSLALYIAGPWAHCVERLRKAR